MKSFTVVLMFLANSCIAQQWQAEIMAGVSGYSGDLAKPAISAHTFGPAFALNAKYLTSNNYITIRAGFSYGRISGDDKYQKNELVNRNLNFKSDLFEGSICVEGILLEPELHNNYPFLFAGVGVFNYNPFTYDDNNNKTFLQPLGTEGQGLAAYPDRKMYNRTQFCIPFGFGWKFVLNEKFDLIYEFGFRYIFTDYLDDVSSEYADPQILLAFRGPISEQLAYRQTKPPTAPIGGIRGNPYARDLYYTTGLKLCIKFGE